MLGNFYKNSQAPAFWKGKVVTSTKETRYRKQSFPTANWVLALVDEYLPQADSLLDYNSKNADFLTMVSQSDRFARVVSINPEVSEEATASLENLRIHDSLSQVGEKVSVFTAFEVLERIFDPITFIRSVYDNCEKGGLFFLTTNTVSGFEYQVLQEKSARLHPPDRISLLSIEAIQARLAEAGFEVIELSTPGRVDVEIVRNALENEPGVSLPEFFEYILKERDENTWHSLQDFLQRNRLSSYLRIAARKG